jgi:hypothetical protein
MPEPPPQPVKDLTKSDWKFSTDKPGTAIYWLIDEKGEYEQVFVPDVVYKRCEDLSKALSTMSGWSLGAFRWVPETVQGAMSLVESKCLGPCEDDLDCVNNSCICIDGFCRRK